MLWVWQYHLTAGEWLGPRAVMNPSQCLNTKALPSRNVALSKGGLVWGIVYLCFQCLAHLALYREYSTSHRPLRDVSGHWRGLGFCSHPRDRDASTAWLIASGVESSRANGQQICLLALTPTYEASLSLQLGLCPLPVPVSASSVGDTLLSWLSLTLCVTILVDSESALDHFCCIQFPTELG